MNEWSFLSRCEQGLALGMVWGRVTGSVTASRFFLSSQCQSCFELAAELLQSIMWNKFISRPKLPRPCL